MSDVISSDSTGFGTAGTLPGRRENFTDFLGPEVVALDGVFCFEFVGVFKIGLAGVASGTGTEAGAESETI